MDKFIESYSLYLLLDKDGKLDEDKHRLCPLCQGVGHIETLNENFNKIKIECYRCKGNGYSEKETPNLLFSKERYQE